MKMFGSISDAMGSAVGTRNSSGAIQKKKEIMENEWGKSHKEPDSGAVKALTNDNSTTAQIADAVRPFSED